MHKGLKYHENGKKWRFKNYYIGWKPWELKLYRDQPLSAGPFAPPHARSLLAVCNSCELCCADSFACSLAPVPLRKMFLSAKWTCLFQPTLASKRMIRKIWQIRKYSKIRKLGAVCSGTLTFSVQLLCAGRHLCKWVCPFVRPLPFVEVYRCIKDQ